MFIDNGRLKAAWVVAIVLFVLKFESAFFLIPLAIYTYRLCGPRFTYIALAAFGAAAIVAELPFFPQSLRAFSRRSVRIDGTPGHSSPTIILDRLGIYDHRIVRPLIVFSLLLIAAALARRRIDLPSAIVLSMFCSFFFLPDESYDRIALILVPLFFIMRFSRRRYILISIATLLSTIALYSVP